MGVIVANAPLLSSEQRQCRQCERMLSQVSFCNGFMCCCRHPLSVCLFVCWSLGDRARAPSHKGPPYHCFDCLRRLSCNRFFSLQLSFFLAPRCSFGIVPRLEKKLQPLTCIV